jgi:hypothetical protein
MRYLIPAAIGLAPIVVVLALRLPLINQLNFADAWFYSAFAWAPKHQFAIFGWNYFSVRFSAILPIGLFERAFGVGDGYLLLRYVLVVACGTSVYLCVRRFASTRVAAGTAVLLYLNPFFSRMLLWDYSGFMEVAAGVMGLALWYWADGRRPAWTVLAGVALACAVFANALVGTALIVLLLVEGIAAARQGGHATRRYVLRLAVLAGAAIGVFLAGYLSYLAILGSLSPYDLLRPTIKFFGENNKQAALYEHPVSTWLLHEPRIWAPVVASVALIATLGRRFLGYDVEARVAQLFVGYTAFLWLYRFLVTSSVIETWWAYSVVVVAMAPALGILVHEFTSKASKPRRWVLVSAAVLAFTLLFIRDATTPAGELYRSLATHQLALILLIGVGLVASAVCAYRPGRAYHGVSLAVLAAVLGVMLYAPSVLDGRGTSGLFVTSGSQEWTGYNAGKRFVDLVQDYDSPSHRVFLWYTGFLGYVSITWADLPQDADTLNQVGVDEPLGRLTALAVARLEQPEVRYVMILAPRPSEVLDARNALFTGGFGGGVVRSGALAGGALQFALVTITKR